MDDLIEGITWYRGSSVRIRRAGLEVHVDPLGVPDGVEADFVLLTHPHFDNFSEEDIERVRTPTSVLVAPASMKKQLTDVDHFMRPGDMLQLDGLDVLSVPAFNHEKKFHPRERGWLGYVFTVGGVTYYHAGDTDFLPAMETVRCDVAFLPCDGRYTMGPEAAARAARVTRAHLVIPIHWGDDEAGRGNAQRLASLFEGRVELLDRAA